MSPLFAGSARADAATGLAALGLFVAFLVGAGSAPGAAHAASLLRADAATVKEHVDGQQRVTTVHVVGASYLDPADTVDPDSLHVFLPRPVRGVVHLEVATVDARYTYSADYPVDEPTKGWAKLEYPSNEKHRLRDRPIAQVAVRAHLKTAAAEGAGPLLLVRWAEGSAPYIVLFVNSEGSDTLFTTPDGDSGFLRHTCRRIADGSTLKFDTVCKVAEDALEKGEPLTLFRRRGTSRLPQIDVRLDR